MNDAKIGPVGKVLKKKITQHIAQRQRNESGNQQQADEAPAQ